MNDMRIPANIPQSLRRLALACYEPNNVFVKQDLEVWITAEVHQGLHDLQSILQICRDNVIQIVDVLSPWEPLFVSGLYSEGADIKVATYAKPCIPNEPYQKQHNAVIESLNPAIPSDLAKLVFVIRSTLVVTTESLYEWLKQAAWKRLVGTPITSDTIPQLQVWLTWITDLLKSCDIHILVDGDIERLDCFKVSTTWTRELPDNKYPTLIPELSLNVGVDVVTINPLRKVTLMPSVDSKYRHLVDSLHNIFDNPSLADFATHRAASMIRDLAKSDFAIVGLDAGFADDSTMHTRIVNAQVSADPPKLQMSKFAFSRDGVTYEIIIAVWYRRCN